jgi:sugar/nucleoside kinase (ribokinase family)
LAVKKLKDLCLKPYKVICLGNVLVDVLAKPVDKLPAKGGLLPVDHIELAMGGCASNTAIALSRLGVKTALWGKLGRDDFGEYALRQLKREKVDASGIVLDAKVSTSATVVLIHSDAQRSFLHSMAANDAISLSDIRFSKFSKFGHLHVGGYFLFPALDGPRMAQVLKAAQKRGLTTSLDTAWDLNGKWLKTLKPCLPYLNYFMPSEREVKMLLGFTNPAKAAKTFQKLGAKNVVVKLGEKGSYLLGQSGAEIRVPAFKAKVMDTTGAGDAFCAGFIKGLSLSLGFKECLKLGNAAGAAAVTALGATAGIKSFQQLLKY